MLVIVCQCHFFLACQIDIVKSERSNANCETHDHAIMPMHHRYTPSYFIRCGTLTLSGFVVVRDLSQHLLHAVHLGSLVALEILLSHLLAQLRHLHKHQQLI